MRVLFATALLAGAIIVSDNALSVAEEPKKEEKKKSSANKADYDEKVSIRPHIGADGKTFGDVIKDVSALRMEHDGKLHFYLIAKGVPEQALRKGTEITDKAGAVYILVKPVAIGQPAGDFAYHTINVEKKPPVKKP
jgi:hypothetical protein